MTALRPARARAACRVDLGGGTLDIWPLGLLVSPGRTVNVAIDVWAEAAITPRRHGWRIELDQGAWDADSREALIEIDAVRLPARVAHALSLPPATIQLASASPRGAGLGASSAIAVALIGAIEQARGETPRDVHTRAVLIRDIEAQMMGRPTGVQDQYPAQLGGALAIDYHPGEVTVRRLRVDLEALAERLVVAYSGQSHISAETNWHMVRACLDGDAEVLGRLRAIAAIAAQMPTALEAGDWPSLGRLVSAEWDQRCRLAEGVSTPLVERLLARALDDGAWGGKVCGAGGGGCIAVLTPPADRAAVCAGLEAEGAQILGAKPTDCGLILVAL